MNTPAKNSTTIRIMMLASVMTICASQAGAASVSPLGPSGGPGGSQSLTCGATFDGATGKLVTISEIRLRSGDFIDAIQVVYTNGVVGKRHGGTGGDLDIFRLAADEKITSIGGKYDRFVESLYIVTSKGRRKDWGDNGGKADFYYSAPPGMWINDFWARSGTYLDAIGVCLHNPN